MSQYFTLPLPHHLQRGSQTPSRSRRRKRQQGKRKRVDTTDDGTSYSDNSEPDDLDWESERAAETPRPDVYRTKDEKIQRDIAGLSISQDVPPPPFPHADPSSRTPKLTSQNVQRELTQLNPPLYNANPVSAGASASSDAKITNLRKHHLGVLTTILHRCLLQGDYHRAGRAWGLLLRSEANSQPLDLRADGYWGIGAELLFHRYPYQDVDRDDEVASSEDNSNKEVDNQPKPLFSERGFEAARDYYNRLILNFPWRKLSTPNVMDERTFYPAMFSLWIYEVCEASKRARCELPEDLRSSSQSPPESEDEDEHSRSSPHQSRAMRSFEANNRIRELELSRAHEIAERMDRLLSGPPYDRDTLYLELRGMAHLWIGDLMVQELPPGDAISDESDSSIGSNESDDVREAWRGGGKRDRATYRRHVEHRRSVKAQRAEHERARVTFEKVRDLGGRLPRA